MSVKRLIAMYMCENLRKMFDGLPDKEFECIEEIRIRADRPVLIVSRGVELFPDGFGGLSDKPCSGFRPNMEDINKVLELISNFSFYAFGEELRCGYITLPEGHRVGMTGRTVTENGRVKSIKCVNGFNFRISHEIKGCAQKVMNHIAANGIRHTMIVSPPGCGKTTLLRDIIRIISTGRENGAGGIDVGVVDERSEIAGCRNGIAQNDVGLRTDVLDACPKPEGMVMLLRSMSPKVIAVDEIGSEADIDAICNIVNAGVKVLCTVHGQNAEDLLKKPSLRRLLEMKVFERFIILKNRGEIANIYDSDMKKIV